MLASAGVVCALRLRIAWAICELLRVWRVLTDSVRTTLTTIPPSVKCTTKQTWFRGVPRAVLSFHRSSRTHGEAMDRVRSARALVALIGLLVVLSHQEFRTQIRLRTKSRSTSQSVAITESGILPYAICGAERADGGAGFHFSSFTLDGKLYRLLITAASAWKSRTYPSRIEFLSFFRPDGNARCPLDSGEHCVVRPLLFPEVSCTVNGVTRPGNVDVPALDHIRALGEYPSVVSITCPMDEVAIVGERIDVELQVQQAALTVSLCKQLVSQVFDLAICTEPLFGYSTTSAFWQGNPPYGKYSLLDQFIVYNIKIVGAHVTIQDKSTHLHSAVKHHIGQHVSYRPSWELLAMGPSTAWDWQVLAEATCLWERRLDSKWVMPNGVDQFLMPMVDGENVAEALGRLDPSLYSGIEIPMVLVHGDSSTNQSATVLQRWNLLEPDMRWPVSYLTPLANPRHVTHQWVHWNTGRTKDFQSNMEPLGVIHDLKLHMVHLMVLSRPHMNQGKSAGQDDAAYSRMGARLTNELAQYSVY